MTAGCSVGAQDERQVDEPYRYLVRAHIDNRRCAVSGINYAGLVDESRAAGYVSFDSRGHGEVVSGVDGR